MARTNSALAIGQSGTRCKRPFLVRSPGMVQTGSASSRSSSDFMAPVTSERRCPVSSSRRRIDRVAGESMRPFSARAMCSPVIVSMWASAFQKTVMLTRVSTRSRGLRAADLRRRAAGLNSSSPSSSPQLKKRLNRLITAVGGQRRRLLRDLVAEAADLDARQLAHLALGEVRLDVAAEDDVVGPRAGELRHGMARVPLLEKLADGHGIAVAQLALGMRISLIDVDFDIDGFGPLRGSRERHRGRVADAVPPLLPRLAGADLVARRTRCARRSG